jgi:hypothetical protein
MVSATPKGDMYFTYNDEGSPMSILIATIMEFYMSNWRYDPYVIEWAPGKFAREKYQLADEEGDALIRGIKTKEQFLALLPEMYARTHGETAARAFPLSQELVEQALAEELIVIY